MIKIQWLLYSLIIVCSLSNGVSLDDSLYSSRGLQSLECLPNSDNATIEIRNVIASMELPALARNNIRVSLFYDIAVTTGFVRELRLGLFDTRFGDISSVVGIDITSFGSLEDVQLEDSNIVANGRARIIELCLDRFVSDEEVISLEFSFSVSGGVCTHSSGRQVIPASWLSEITGGIVPERAAVDYLIRIDGGSNFDISNYDIKDNFIPSSNITTVENFSFFQRIFITYESNQLDFSLDDFENILLFLPQNAFDSSEVNDCTESFGDSLFVAVLLGIPTCTCCCLIGVIAATQYQERRQLRGILQESARRRNQQLRHYPGDNDIVLVPGGGNNVVDTTDTVDAILETDDETGFDAVIETTTIDVSRQRD